MKKFSIGLLLSVAILLQPVAFIPTAQAAAVSITAGSFAPSTDAVYLAGRNYAGAAITQGQAVYIDTSATVTAGRIKLASAAGTGLAPQVVGLAANAASAGQPIKILIRDPSLTLGGTIAAGDVLYLHTTAGAVTVTYADLTTGHFVSVLGVGIGGNKVNFGGTKAGASTFLGVIRADVAK